MKFTSAICILIFAIAIGGEVFADSRHFDSFNSKIEIFPGKPIRYEIKNTSAWATYIRILGATHQDKNCKTDGFYRVDIVKPAAHGVVCTRIEDGTRTIDHEGTLGACVGTPSQFIVVYFEPSKGFIGGDTFTYSLSDPSNNVNLVAEVAAEIRQGSDTAGSTNDGSHDVHQSAGRAPQCQAIVD